MNTVNVMLEAVSRLTLTWDVLKSMFNTEEIADCTVININMRCIEIADWLRHTAGY